MNTRSINCKLKASLIRRSSEQGFAMPVAIGLGLVMLLVGATMIVRSQSEQAIGSAQKNTALGLSAAEAGVTKVQSFLNTNRFLAVEDYPWTRFLLDSTTGAACASASATYAQANAFNSSQYINNGTQQFKVISYSYELTDRANNEGIGTLVVEGRSLLDTAITSTSRLQVKIPIQRKVIPTVVPPGLWANGFSIAGNKFRVQSVIDSGCPSTITAAQQRGNFSNPAGGGVPNVLQDPSYQLGLPLPVPSTCAASASSPSFTKPCAIAVTGPVTGSATPGTIFPSTTDITNYPAGTGTKGEYIYYISNGGGTNSINLSGNNGIVTIRPDKKVSFYLQGNLNMSGSSRLGHDCFDSVASPDGLPDDNNSNGVKNYAANRYSVLDENDRGSVSGVLCNENDFQIYGGTATTQILLGGSNLLSTFIYAPNASGGINGNAIIKGSVWLKGWDGSATKQDVVVQTGEWDNLPTSMFPPNLVSIGSWERQVVP